MSMTFRDAFMWHLDHYPFRLADICRATGVSRDVVNKLKFNPTATTAIENAVRIARFYNKSVEEFCALAEPSRLSAFEALWLELTEDERRVVEATMRALAAQHADSGVTD